MSASDRFSTESLLSSSDRPAPETAATKARKQPRAAGKILGVEQKSESVVRVDGEEVLVIRSARRQRTVSADLAGGTLRLRVPAGLSRAQVETHARAFRRRFESRAAAASHSDEALLTRARELSARHLNSHAQPSSVTWSDRQLKRWGSTTTTTGGIRLSARLRKMPGWVVDSVLIHELAHLIEPGHGQKFQELVARYPHTKEADAFLAGVTWAEQQR